MNVYLSGIQPELSAKVFRTYHATAVVQTSLAQSAVQSKDPEYEKREAAVLANMEAAILCNHTKKAPANWSDRRVTMRERRERARTRVVKYRQQLNDYRTALKELRLEAREKTTAANDKRRPKVRERYKKRVAVAQRRIEGAQGRLDRARLALGKVESRNRLAARGREWNLGTSLKSYIDPRVYTRWGQQVEYDVLERYYPKLLRSKFAWAAAGEEEE